MQPNPRAYRSKRNFKGLQLPGGASAGDGRLPGRDGEARTLTENLEFGIEFQADIHIEDLQRLEELGEGSGGTVSKVLHVPTKTIMAKKAIHVEAQPTVKTQILRELRILHDCESPYIVSFFGAFVHGGDICICMEFMDCGSLDKIYKKYGAIQIEVLSKIAYSVLRGLIYLYEKHRIIHRDVKPSNILVNLNGDVKICDFGVSGELINSLAQTFVGTSAYMSPERIQGGQYSVKSDVWSLGIAMMEMAMGSFPLPAGVNQLSIFEQLQFIINEDMPPLPDGRFPPEFEDFVHKCVQKDPLLRPTPKQLWSHTFVDTDHYQANMGGWAKRHQLH